MTTFQIHLRRNQVELLGKLQAKAKRKYFHYQIITFICYCRLKKIDHTYSKDVKKQIQKTKAQGNAKIRNSAMMTFQNTKGE